MAASTSVIEKVHFVLRLLNNQIEPDAHIGGQHVHQTEFGHRGVLDFNRVHLQSNNEKLYYFVLLTQTLSCIVTLALRNIKYIWMKMKSILEAGVTAKTVFSQCESVL